ncbi:PTS lactose/cellobiose transporter subunit IIA [Virgibacillus dakarensis]|uniref:PTS cellobiose transporter subunit IIA n=1 Tax=Lentibacillus populi TaxID=1827502 RepID=A0A9W5TXB1_9BACI|nr:MULTISPECIES: PTS lactose/cellobiose transporter subunit IIA [Bacillaceae]MBT2217206.1 PTS lactose/cellobiose transporter subunit IIA [Virgibacillus dakarensis]MTW85792.1 PTS lactose/cellobiose transporter subunit IIA [Virgibacillus dakarensis]GGB43266.1 PTS cellobiose transporter subunit IIA [Lentibacillus populi]
MVDESLNTIAFQIISNVGSAKSLAMEALYAAKRSDFALAEEKLVESKKYFVEGHKVHASLIQKEAAGDKVEFSLLFMHAEDQLMSTETITELVKEMIEMYKKIVE